MLYITNARVHETIEAPQPTLSRRAITQLAAGHDVALVRRWIISSRSVDDAKSCTSVNPRASRTLAFPTMRSSADALDHREPPVQEPKSAASTKTGRHLVAYGIARTGLACWLGRVRPSVEPTWRFSFVWSCTGILSTYDVVLLQLQSMASLQVDLSSVVTGTRIHLPSYPSCLLS